MGVALDNITEAFATTTAAGGTRVVVVTGCPGIGKTSVALRWAHAAAGNYPDGQLWVNLHGYDESRQLRPDDVLERFLRDLGVPPRVIPTSPRCAAVVTSRTRLTGLSLQVDARHITLSPLTTTESLELLAHATCRERVDSNLEAATAIAAKCSQLPLGFTHCRASIWPAILSWI